MAKTEVVKNVDTAVTKETEVKKDETVEVVASIDPLTELKNELMNLRKELSVLKGDKKKVVLKADKKTPDVTEFFDKEKEMAPVKGLFKFFSEKNGTLKWFDRFPWRGAKMTKYEAKDNQIIELPYYVARRLMEKGHQPVYGEVIDDKGMKVTSVIDYQKRFDFFPHGQFINVDRKPRIIKPI